MLLRTVWLGSAVGAVLHTKILNYKMAYGFLACLYKSTEELLLSLWRGCHTLKFYVKVTYVMGKSLSGEVSWTGTGLVCFVVFLRHIENGRKNGWVAPPESVPIHPNTVRKFAEGKMLEKEIKMYYHVNPNKYHCSCIAPPPPVIFANWLCQNYKRPSIKSLEWDILCSCQLLY